MKIKRIYARLPWLVLKKILTFRLLEPMKIRKELVDETEFILRTTEYNEARDKFFSENTDKFAYLHKNPLPEGYSSPETVLRLGWLLSEMEFDKNLFVLDFGTGYGWLAYWLNSLGFNIYGIDESKVAVENLSRNFDKFPFFKANHSYQFIHYNGERIPLPDCSVHYATCFDSLGFTPNHLALMKEIHRILVPGGKFLITGQGERSAGENPAGAVRVKFPGPDRKLNIYDMEAKAKQTGFEKVSIKPYLYDYREILSEERYRKLLDGFIDLNVLYTLRNSIMIYPLIICIKSGDLEQSFYPKVAIEAQPESLSCKTGDKFSIKIKLTNTGSMTLVTAKNKSGGYALLNLKIVKQSDQFQVRENRRIKIPGDMMPGEYIRMNLTDYAPHMEGKYFVQIELLYENLYWLSDIGIAPRRIPLETFK